MVRRWSHAFSVVALLAILQISAGAGACAAGTSMASTDGTRGIGGALDGTGTVGSGGGAGEQGSSATGSGGCSLASGVLPDGTQNGPDASSLEQTQIVPSSLAGLAELTQGGGVGGVGGTGLGCPLNSFPAVGGQEAQGLTFLYPYDKTVWPRGLLAPLLMWTWNQGDADAIRIHLQTKNGSFSWTGQFGRPAILAMTGGKFVNHPIPQDVWEKATSAAAGSNTLTVSLTVAREGIAYGPISETWTIAPGRLAGTVYYGSYGTELVKNSTDLDAEGNQYGAAILGITPGASAPTVIAGSPSGLDGSGCRACHALPADGSRMVVEHGDNYASTSNYELKNGNTEIALAGYDSLFNWAGLYPDGSLALTNAAAMGGTPSVSQLYAFPPASSTPLAAIGIPADFEAGAPAFSPDGKHVAFDFIGGTIGASTGEGTALAALDFDKASLSFSNLRVLAVAPPGQPAGFPSWFPTNDAIAYHFQIAPAMTGQHRYDTWHQAKAQIWWSDLETGTASVLGALNGLEGDAPYLPIGPDGHGDDTVLNYEPTVAPTIAGGYAWVLFTSRRLYGNVATHDPWQSDPRNYDATQYANITTKKLWMAAVDIGSMKNGSFVERWNPGTDPSHPAFYLPGQELVSGNARGFWALDPCRTDGTSCMGGDQCCNGYCQPNGAGGAQVCGPMGTKTCAAFEEKCSTAADCCEVGALCVGGYCAPPPTP